MSRRERRERVLAEETAKKAAAGTHKLSKKFKIATITLTVILGVAIIAAGIGYWYVNSKLNKIDRPAEDIKEEDLSITEVTGWTNVLLLGVDSRNISDAQGSRTDCIIIASINNDTKKIYLTSIYRDTYIRLGGGDIYDKINHAFAEGGAKESIKTVNEALDLNIKDYVLFNFKAVSDVVDLCGGITLNIEDYEIEQLNRYAQETARIIDYGDCPDVTEPGEQTICGPQAVSYGRIRKGVGDDFKRTERMRTVISVLLKEIKSESLKNIDKIADTALSQVQTNMANGDILSLIARARNMDIAGSEGFPYNITTGSLYGVSYVFPTDLATDVATLHKNIFGESQYEPSETVKTISNQILYDITGVANPSTVDPNSYIEDPTQGEVLDPVDPYTEPEPESAPAPEPTPNPEPNPEPNPNPNPNPEPNPNPNPEPNPNPNPEPNPNPNPNPEPNPNPNPNPNPGP